MCPQLEDFFRSSASYLNSIDAYDRTALIVAIEHGHKNVLEVFFSMSELNVNKKVFLFFSLVL